MSDAEDAGSVQGLDLGQGKGWTYSLLSRTLQFSAWSNLGSGIILLSIALLVTADVIGRWLLDSPIQGTLEISVNAFVLVVFGALAFYEIEKGGIRLELVTDRLSPVARFWCQVLARVLGTVVYGIMTWRTFTYAVTATVKQEATWGLVEVPIWPSKIVVTVGLLMLFVASLVLLADLARGPRAYAGIGRADQDSTSAVI